jgi:hypothetical protein
MNITTWETGIREYGFRIDATREEVLRAVEMSDTFPNEVTILEGPSCLWVWVMTYSQERADDLVDTVLEAMSG